MSRRTLTMRVPSGLRMDRLALKACAGNEKTSANVPGILRREQDRRTPGDDQGVFIMSGR